MHVTPEVYREAVAYLKITFTGLPALFIYLTFQSLMRSIGKVKLPFYIVLSTVLLNLALDPLFVFAKEVAAFFIPTEPLAIHESAVFIKTLSVSFGFLGVLIVLMGAFRGAGKTKISMILALLSVWLLHFPLAYYLRYHTS